MNQEKPFTLKGFGIMKLALEFTQPENAPSPRGALTDWNFSSTLRKHKENPRDCLIEFRVKFHEYTSEFGKHGYVGEVVIRGAGIIGNEIKDEDVPSVALQNGVHVLYGTLRGLLAVYSSHLPAGDIMLPSFSTAEILAICALQEMKARPDVNETAERAVREATGSEPASGESLLHSPRLKAALRKAKRSEAIKKTSHLKKSTK